MTALAKECQALDTEYSPFILLILAITIDPPALPPEFDLTNGVLCPCELTSPSASKGICIP